MSVGETHIYLHPFKEGVRNLLRKHFSEEIVKRFLLEFEVSIYNPNFAENVWRQKKDGNLVLEVRYKTKRGSEFICDLYSWESRAATEAKLLRYITDAYKAGKIGTDWQEKGGGIGVNREILSGEYATKEAKHTDGSSKSS